jgi:hypothetical protein
VAGDVVAELRQLTRGPEDGADEDGDAAPDAPPSSSG